MKAQRTQTFLPEKLNGEQTKKICLFVCTGNTCRSPMAEALLNKKYGDVLRGESCGLFADGSEISANAEYALHCAGIDDFQHTSRNVNEELMSRAEKVIGLTKSHAARLTALYPQFAAKICAMPIDIPDPYGGSREEYKNCLSAIEKAIDMMFSNSYEENN